MKFLLFLLVLSLALFLNVVFTTLPLVLVVLLAFGLAQKSSVVFLAAFVYGIILDIFLLHLIGESAMFFLCALFLAFLYQKKLDVSSIYFMFIYCTFTCLIYLFIFRVNYVIWQTLGSSVIGLFCFVLFKPKVKYVSYGGL